MSDLKRVINGMECCLPMTTKNGFADCKQCPYDRKITLEGGVTECCHELMLDALALLKAQEEATIEPKRIDLPDETKAWLDKMDAVDALGNIADICIDWDGYRTVDGLGGLINEIWAYARYCANRLLKAQEPVEPIRMNHNMDSWLDHYKCPVCDGLLTYDDNYCSTCGRKVKWE